MKNKMFKYFPNLSAFYDKHPSVSSSDDGYIVSADSSTVIGSPGILWENICFIESENLMWTHGHFYADTSFTETDPTVPSYVKSITQANITAWNSYANVQANWNETNSSSASYIQNKPTIPSISGLATETYVNNKVAGIVNSAPETLDTLNELATALGNDPNFATTVSNEIGTKVSKTELSNQSYVTTTALSNQSYVTQTFLSNQGYLTSFTETDPVFSASAAAGITSSNITSWNNKVSANNSTITIQKNGTTVDSFTTNASSAKSINITFPEVPAYTSSDSGKVLSVNSSGQLVWITPVSIYSGNDAPNNQQGNNGDIYLQTD